MPKISVVALPKSASGRQAKPLDKDMATELVNLIRKSDGSPDKNGNRPFFVTEVRHDSKGRASAEGRRYANHVREELELEKVSVRVYPDGKKFGWGLYLPLPEKPDENAA